MATYAIHYVTGETEGGFESTAEALHALERSHPDLWAWHDGDLDEGGDRTLVWETEADSEDDDGRNAFASIRREAADAGSGLDWGDDVDPRDQLDGVDVGT